MIDFLRNVGTKVADFCWPRVCPIVDCARPSDRKNRYICSQCFATLPWYEGKGTCKICGAPVATEAAFDFVCDNCKESKPKYEFARSAVIYDVGMRALILGFKFKRQTWLKNDLVDILEGCIRAKFDYSAIDVVVPVPLHEVRLKERGFNQSSLIAEELASRINRRFDDTSLVRARNTEHQTRVNGAERAKNVADAFDVCDSSMIRGRTVLLIDDVMTTGATLNDCARALCKADAERVWCATIARRVLD